VSHESAAWLWGLAPPPDLVDVTVPGRNCRTRAGLRVFRVATLQPADQGDLRGIPVTSPARTLHDLAGRRDDDVLERALSEAFARQLVTERELHATLARNRGRKGGSAVARLLDGGPAITQSKGERLLLKIVRDAGLPRPQTNVKVEGKRVDAWWPEHKLVVEIDGYPVHGHRRAFESDRATDQRLVAAGYRVMRITWRQLVERPLLVAANLAAALARAP
jgi:very-short-patch-repair endonuclease